MAAETSQLASTALSTFIAEDSVSQRLLEQVKRTAAASSTVLIQGESGAGKDHVASLLRDLGGKQDQPRVKTDCAPLPPSLLEIELFGYERGAVTGAAQAKRGRMELA